MRPQSDAMPKVPKLLQFHLDSRVDNSNHLTPGFEVRQIHGVGFMPEFRSRKSKISDGDTLNTISPKITNKGVSEIRYLSKITGTVHYLESPLYYQGQIFEHYVIESGKIT